MMHLSVVLPFYRRAAIFRRALSRNRIYLRPGYEILVVMDDPEGVDQVLAIAAEYPQVNWQVVLNEEPHAWRNPAKAINVGLRHARGEFVLVGSPETVWITDVPNILLRYAQNEHRHFHFGEITFASPEEVHSLNDLQSRVKYSCGSICTKKSNLEAIGGYDESLIGWGVDDDNLRARLALSGVYGRLHQEAQLLHPPQVEKHRFYSADTAIRLLDLVKPVVARVNGDDWGRDFDKVIFQTS
jgi:glycosyltransferase involved in cell wall biosynthesis